MVANRLDCGLAADSGLETDCILAAHCRLQPPCRLMAKKRQEMENTPVAVDWPMKDDSLGMDCRPATDWHLVTNCRLAKA